VAYHGGAFCGWQRQREGRSVQATLEQAVSTVVGEPVTVRAAGRTDAGVHARGQMVSMRITSRVEPHKLPLALQAHLPDDISVVSAERLPQEWAGFDAKHHSVGKCYRYAIYGHEVRDPFAHATSWQVRESLNLVDMRAAAALLVGEHDFNAFRAADCDAAHARRYLWRVAIDHQAPMTFIEVRGNAFCRNMVRIIVGTLVDVGRGRCDLQDVRTALTNGQRTSAGITAPAHGLSLESVYYPDNLADAHIPADAVFPGHPVDARTWPPDPDLPCA
jgi:tRNA pseudouridine38-40 synthase